MQQNAFTKQARKVLRSAREAACANGERQIGSEYLLAGLLREEGVACRILQGQGLDLAVMEEILDELALHCEQNPEEKELPMAPEAEAVLVSSGEIAARYGSEKIGTEHLLFAIIENPACSAARILVMLEINPSRIYAEILVAMGREEEFSREESAKLRGGPEERKSKTQTLDRFSEDLTQKAADHKLDPLIGREEELGRLIRILSRRAKNNPCLIGEPGVGKTAIVEGLAQRIAAGAVPEQLSGKRILALDLSGMVAGTKYRGEFEERIKALVQEAAATGDVILFLDELHTMIGAGGAEGSLDAANILKPALSRGEIRMIGATTVEEYRKYIEKDAALERRFQSVTVEEPDLEQTIEILKGLRSRYENHHHVQITEEGIRAAAELSERYISGRFLPDKAIDVMDEAASRAQLAHADQTQRLVELDSRLSDLQIRLEEELANGTLEEAAQCRREIRELRAAREEVIKKYHQKLARRKISVGEAEAAAVVAEWTHIPVSRLTQSEAVRLKKLEVNLHKSVIAQDEAVSAAARAVRRGRVGLKSPARPIGSFLFLGPTGVGKTEISKALAREVFGSEEALIRVDMSEYMEKHSVSKMIGSPPGYVGYEEGGQLAEQVRRRPYSLILFDEIEKAHPDVFNILLQVLDEGHITDAQGRKVDFKNTILIMTSNAGAQSIITPKKLGFAAAEDEKADYERMKSAVMEEVHRIFRPEFLNRIDEVIVFHVLSKENMKDIVTLMTNELEERCKKQMDITLHVRDSVKKHIVEKAYDPKYGARPLRRMIQTRIEDVLADEILSGKIRRGDRVSAGMKKDEIVFERVCEESERSS